MLTRPLTLIALLLCLTACGVPRSVRPFAAAQPLPDVAALSDDDVRTALRQQADAWTTFALLIRRQELFGLPAVDEDFLQTVDAARAVARRQRDLMDAQTDDPAKNRELLANFHRLWLKTRTYLSQ